MHLKKLLLLCEFLEIENRGAFRTEQREDSIFTSIVFLSENNEKFGNVNTMMLENKRLKEENRKMRETLGELNLDARS